MGIPTFLGGHQGSIFPGPQRFVVICTVLVLLPRSQHPHMLVELILSF